MPFRDLHSIYKNVGNTMSQNLDKKVHYTFASREDAQKSNQFFNETYNVKRTKSDWLWEFSFNQSGTTTIPYVIATYKGDVKGTQAYIEVPFCSPNGVFKSGKTEDTLVDPVLRGLGVFSKMYSMLFKRAVSEQVKMIWGFTPAEKAFENVGFKVIGRTSQLLKPLRASAIFDLTVTTKTSKKFQIKSLAYFLGFIWLCYTYFTTRSRNSTGVTLTQLKKAPVWSEDITKQFIKEWGGSTILRSTAFLKWRFFENPLCKSDTFKISVDGVILGFVTTSQKDGIFYIVDLIVTSPKDKRIKINVDDILDEVLDELAAMARISGSSCLRFWHGSDHKFSQLVKKAAQRSGWLLFKRGMAVVAWHSPDCEHANQINHSSDMYITRAYTEGYFG